ncbi:MAG: hypothetical protein JXA18_05650 [Chitinispirillaceae bacterium]|nr:hypothetical protein [Chitinispirillaceae bacterium]
MKQWRGREIFRPYENEEHHARGRLCVPAFMVALLAMLCYSGEVRQAGVTVSESSINNGNDDFDSIRVAVDNLKREADALRLQVEAIRDTIALLEARHPDGAPADVHAEKRRPVVSSKDTVQFLSKENAVAFLETIRGKKRGSRERGYGGGIGAIPGMYAMCVTPVNEVIDGYLGMSDEMRNIIFPINRRYEQFFLMGINGYGALGNGLRIGGSYRGGSKSVSAHHDTALYTLEIKNGFGGFLLEKAMVKGDFNWFVGGIAGGGHVALHLFKTVEKDTASFSSPFAEQLDGEPYFQLNAPALLLELHGGFTYTMVNWFHIGIDLSTPLLLSPSGFKTPSNKRVAPFTTINPGLQFRIILGNIG